MTDIVKVKKNIRISIIDAGFYDFPDSFQEFINFMKEKMEKIPSEYREEAEIEFESGDEYDRGSYEIYFYRPETDQEEIDRLRSEQAREDASKIGELKKLAELQKKYGVTQ